MSTLILYLQKVSLHYDYFSHCGILFFIECCKSQLVNSELKKSVLNVAQAFRRRPLRYDISVDDQTEVDPREHDWLFYLNKDGTLEF